MSSRPGAAGPSGDGGEQPVVLHLIGSLEIGGTEAQLVRFIDRASAPERHVVALFSTVGPLAAELARPPLLLGRLGRRPRDLVADLRTWSALRRAIADTGAAVVHAHLGMSELLAAAAAPRRVPIVASRRGLAGRYEGNRLFRLLEGLAHRRTRIMICNSEFLAMRTRERDLFPPPIRVIRNGVDLERFTPAPFPVDGPPTVVSVANLNAHKGQARLLEALRLLREELAEARLVLVGDGRDRRRLEELAATLGLAGAVRFEGHVLDPRPFLAQAHVVALASDHEGFPNALLEAMASGRPVVATRVGGVPELVQDGTSGFLTEPDPARLAERLRHLLTDRVLRQRMGSAARARAEAFSWERVVRETEGVYREVLADPAR
jgi:glycosyltransferase involved in cell wall biosynthesis